MNISTTAKRLLGAATMLGIVAVASSAYASYTYTDDFEAYTVGDPIDGSTTANMSWSAGGDDLSTVASTNRPSWDGSTVPVSPTAPSKVLSLDTQATSVTNTPTALPADAI